MPGARRGIYLLANYLALERAPAIGSSINRLLHGGGATAMFVLYLGLGVAGTAFVLRFGRRSVDRLTATLVLLLVFLVMYGVERGAAERFHMIQYGVFGALLFCALRLDLDTGRAPLYMVGAALGALRRLSPPTPSPRRSPCSAWGAESGIRSFTCGRNPMSPRDQRC